MEKCINCGISETSTLLFYAISNEGIVKMCGKCLKEKNLPRIKRFASGNNLMEEEPKQSVYERLSKLSGYKKEETLNPKKTPEINLNPEQKEENQKLKEIVEKMGQKCEIRN